VAEALNQASGDIKLIHLLSKYQAKHDFFHCAGNDAYFTLKLLLALAAENLQEITVRP
jgi:hypothetical protein